MLARDNMAYALQTQEEMKIEKIITHRVRCLRY
jgi:hypothetical protein